MSVEGRWAGRYFEWPCTGCGHVVCALQVPADGDERCSRCKADEALRGIDDAQQRLIEWLERERLEWRAKCWAAERDLEVARREIANLKGAAA